MQGIQVTLLFAVVPAVRCWAKSKGEVYGVHCRVWMKKGCINVNMRKLLHM